MKVKVDYKFDEDPFKEFLVAMKEFARQSVVVGVVGEEADKIHPTAHGDLSTGEIALIQEFGTAHIPARPFLRNALVGNSAVKDALVEAARRVVHKYSTPRRALARAGETLANLVRGELLGGTPPPNAPATVKWKGHGDTLIGLTGALYDAISFQIRGK